MVKSLLIENIRKLSEKPLSELLVKFNDTSKQERQDNKQKQEKQKSDWLEYGLAACCRACIEGLSITPFDEQLLAARYLYEGKIVEMATGEGKTVSAVFAAFLNYGKKRSTHILTFNDYLAKRDYNWMKPVYDRLGLSLSHITEKTSLSERRSAYLCDVVYTTAKECGFDYLRDFIAFSEKDVVHNELCCAIVDEADSILIDEARIPLVIAGKIPMEASEKFPEIYSFISSLTKNAYSFSREDKGVFFTDTGIETAEKHFNIDNLFDEENSNLLTILNNCLRAEFYLKENKDYIIKNGEIKIIDEFTGRVAESRHYPGSLQMAVEAKHGLKTSSSGITMGTIPLQFFIRQYKHVAGMTGTALSSAEEFELLYGLMLEVIPPHIPSRRTDHPIQIYYSKQIKWEQIVKTILTAHKIGQPVLVGTQSIKESENLAAMLEHKGITNTSVLNAKNDEMEADIIKNAGAFGAITISANMAGRGVDILLGGSEQKSYEQVIKASGLLVISSGLHESSRINQQLRGRCGRQGDIGESRVFCSLDDDIMVKYNLKKLIPESRYPSFTDEMIVDKTVVREVNRIQRISEGDKLDERKRLLKFTMISEKHREAIFNTRMKYLKEQVPPRFWQEGNPQGYEEAVKKFGEENVSKIQKEIILFVINDVWSEYLNYTSELRAGIHLTSVGGKNPSEEFNIASEEFYLNMSGIVESAMLEQLDVIMLLDKTENFKIKKPESIWTFLLDESGDELVKKPFLVNFSIDDSEYNDIVNVDLDKEERIGENPAVNEKQGFFSSLFNKKKK